MPRLSEGWYDTGLSRRAKPRQLFERHGTRVAPRSCHRPALGTQRQPGQHLAQRSQSPVPAEERGLRGVSRRRRSARSCCSTGIRKTSTSSRTRIPTRFSDLFRNCRLIGRRFRLAHVRFGRDIVEVATFRAASVPSPTTTIARTPTAAAFCATTSTARSTRTFGGATSRSTRCTTTSRTSASGITSTASRDVRARTLRLIGDPEKRYREDPVRMLRAVRFAAKLDFTLAPETAAPIASLGSLLKRRAAGAVVRRAARSCSRAAMPCAASSCCCNTICCVICSAIRSALLETADRDKIVDVHPARSREHRQRVREDKPITPMFLYALFLWFPIQALARRLESEGWNDGQAMLEASQRIVATQQTAFPRRFSSPMKELLNMQWRFAQTARRACRAPAAAQAFPRGLRLPRAARELRRSRPRNRRLVDRDSELAAGRAEQAAELEPPPGRRRRGGRRRGGRHHEINDVVV